MSAEGDGEYSLIDCVIEKALLRKNRRIAASSGEAVRSTLPSPYLFARWFSLGYCFSKA